MKHTFEAFSGWIVAAVVYTIGHYNTIIAALIGTVSLLILLFKLRREWVHRNDPPLD